METFYDPSLKLYLPLWKRDGSSIISDDQYGHLCTVTGATWGLQGRTFDGSDDQIAFSDASLPLGATARTVIIWFKRNTTGNFPAGTSPSPFYYGAQVQYQGFGLHGDGNAIDLFLGGYNYRTDTTINLDDLLWHHFAVSFDGTTATIYWDGALNTSFDFSLLNTVSGGASAGLLGFGYRQDAVSGRWNGVIGDYFVYSRVLSVLEIQHNRRMTIWRYV